MFLEIEISPNLNKRENYCTGTWLSLEPKNKNAAGHHWRLGNRDMPPELSLSLFPTTLPAPFSPSPLLLSPSSTDLLCFSGAPLIAQLLTALELHNLCAGSKFSKSTTSCQTPDQTTMARGWRSSWILKAATAAIRWITVVRWGGREGRIPRTRGGG